MVEEPLRFRFFTLNQRGHQLANNTEEALYKNNIHMVTCGVVEVR